MYETEMQSTQCTNGCSCCSRLIAREEDLRLAAEIGSTVMARNKELNLQLEEGMIKQEEMIQQIEHLERNNQDLSVKFNAAQRKEAMFQSEIAELQKKNDSLKEKVAAVDTEKIQINAKLNSLQAEIDLRAKTQADTAKLDDALKQNLKAERDDLTVQLANAKAQLSSLKAKIESETSPASTANGEGSGSRLDATTLAEIEKENASLLSRLQQAKDELEFEKEQTTELQSQLFAMQEAKDGAMAQVANVTQAYERVNLNCVQLATSRTKAKNKLRQTRDSLHHLESEFEAFKQQQQTKAATATANQVTEANNNNNNNAAAINAVHIAALTAAESASSLLAPIGDSLTHLQQQHEKEIAEAIQEDEMALKALEERNAKQVQVLKEKIALLEEERALVVQEKNNLLQQVEEMEQRMKREKQQQKSSFEEQVAEMEEEHIKEKTALTKKIEQLTEELSARGEETPIPVAAVVEEEDETDNEMVKQAWEAVDSMKATLDASEKRCAELEKELETLRQQQEENAVKDQHNDVQEKNALRAEIARLNLQIVEVETIHADQFRSVAEAVEKDRDLAIQEREDIYARHKQELAHLEEESKQVMVALETRHAESISALQEEHHHLVESQKQKMAELEAEIAELKAKEATPTPTPTPTTSTPAKDREEKNRLRETITSLESAKSALETSMLSLQEEITVLMRSHADDKALLEAEVLAMQLQLDAVVDEKYEALSQIDALKVQLATTEQQEENENEHEKKLKEEIAEMKQAIESLEKSKEEESAKYQSEIAALQQQGGGGESKTKEDDQEIEALKAQVASLEEGKVEKGEEIAKLQGEIETLRQNAGAAQEVDSLKEEIAKLQAEIETLRSANATNDESAQEIELLKEEIAKYQAEIETLRNAKEAKDGSAQEIDSLKAQIASLEDQIAKYQVEIASLQTANATTSESSQEVESLKEQIAKYQMEISSLQQSSSGAAEVEALKEQIAKFQAEIASLQTTNEAKDGSSQEIESLKEELAKYQAEISSLQQNTTSEIEPLQQQIASFEEQISTFQAEISSLQQDKAILEAQLTATKEQFAISEASKEQKRAVEVNQLTQRLEVATKEKSSLESQLERLKAQLDMEHQQLSSSADEKERLVHEERQKHFEETNKLSILLETVTKEKSSLESQLEKTKEQLAALSASKDELESKLNEKVSQLDTAVEALQKEKVQLENQLETIKEQQQQLEQSLREQVLQENEERHTEEVTQLRVRLAEATATLNREKEDWEAKSKAQLAALSAEQDTRERTLRKEWENKLEVEKENSAREINLLNVRLEETLLSRERFVEEEREVHAGAILAKDMQIQELRQNFEEEKQQLQQQIEKLERSLQDARSETQALQALEVKKHQDEETAAHSALEMLQQQHKDAIQALRQQHESTLAAIERENLLSQRAAGHAAREEEREEWRARINDEIAAERAKLQKEYEEKLDAIRSQWKQSEATLRSQLIAEMNTLRDQFNAARREAHRQMEISQESVKMQAILTDKLEESRNLMRKISGESQKKERELQAQVQGLVKELMDLKGGDAGNRKSTRARATTNTESVVLEEGLDVNGLDKVQQRILLLQQNEFIADLEKEVVQLRNQNRILEDEASELGVIAGIVADMATPQRPGSQSIESLQLQLQQTPQQNQNQRVSTIGGRASISLGNNGTATTTAASMVPLLEEQLKVLQDAVAAMASGSGVGADVIGCLAKRAAEAELRVKQTEDMLKELGNEARANGGDMSARRRTRI